MYQSLEPKPAASHLTTSHSLCTVHLTFKYGCLSALLSWNKMSSLYASLFSFFFFFSSSSSPSFHVTLTVTEQTEHNKCKSVRACCLLLLGRKTDILSCFISGSNDWTWSVMKNNPCEKRESSWIRAVLLTEEEGMLQLDPTGVWRTHNDWPEWIKWSVNN